MYKTSRLIVFVFVGVATVYVAVYIAWGVLHVINQLLDKWL
jgi:hypothetical protein